jgi:hypothetical protein
VCSSRWRFFKVIEADDLLTMNPKRMFVQETRSDPFFSEVQEKQL